MAGVSESELEKSQAQPEVRRGARSLDGQGPVLGLALCHIAAPCKEQH